MKKSVVLTSLALALLGGAAQAAVTIVDLGTGPPPAMLGTFPTTPFDFGAQASIPDGQTVTFVPGFPGGSLVLFSDAVKRTVPTTWPSWGHGFVGPVFEVLETSSLEMFLPEPFSAFYFYLRPASGSVVVNVLAGGASSGPITLSAAQSARGFGFYTTEGDLLYRPQISISGGGSLAIGEFGWADRTSTCTIGSVTIPATVDGIWTSDCGSTEEPSNDAQYFRFELATALTLEVELASELGSPRVLVWNGEEPGGELVAVGDSFSSPRLARTTPQLGPGSYVVEAINDNGPSGVPFSLSLREIAGICDPNRDSLCIDAEPGDRRFKVSTRYGTVLGGGQTGEAQVARTDFERGGVFWFFNYNNPEVMVKVLKGCAVNDHMWVFVSAVTNVGFTVEVTDTVTGEVWVYDNPDQHVSVPRQDTKAFVCSD